MKHRLIFVMVPVFAVFALLAGIIGIRGFAHAAPAPLVTPKYDLTPGIYNLFQDPSTHGYSYQLLNAVNSVQLGNNQFQGPPAGASNSQYPITGSFGAAKDASTAKLLIAGIDNNGVARMGVVDPSLADFSGFLYTFPISSGGNLVFLTGQLGLAYDITTDSFFVAGRDHRGVLYIAQFQVGTPAGPLPNDTVGQLTPWIAIGGGLNSNPVIASDVSGRVLVMAEAPVFAGNFDNWYALINTSTDVPYGIPGEQWRHFASTCEGTPSLVYQGPSADNYRLDCVASDDQHLWENTFDVKPNSSSLTGWHQVGGTSIALSGQSYAALNLQLSQWLVAATTLGGNNVMSYNYGGFGLAVNYPAVVVPVYFP